MATDKHDNEYILVPKIALPEMLGAWYRCKNGHHFVGDPATTDTSDMAAYSSMLSAAPAYEPSDEAVEQSAQALLVAQFGMGALMLFDPPREMTAEEEEISRDRIDLARRQARAVIRTFTAASAVNKRGPSNEV